MNARLTANPSTYRPDRRRPAARRKAFSLIEMLATVAALVIVLGLMVSLARYVRRQASDELTKQLLGQLDLLIERYQARYNALPGVPAFVDGKLPAVQPPATATLTPPSPGVAATPTTPLMASPPDDALPDEPTLQKHADLNNRSLVQALRIEARRHPAEYEQLPQSFFVDGRLLDAWGTPIVFMPALHPAVGMAMENRPFFLSAGPDGRFRTSEDNLYSYEAGEGGGVE